MPRAAVELVARNDMCFALAQHLVQSLFHLVGRQCGLVLVMQRVDILAIPDKLSDRFIVDSIDSVGRDDRPCTVDETVATLPQHFVHVVGYAHLPV